MGMAPSTRILVQEVKVELFLMEFMAGAEGDPDPDPAGL